MNSIDAANPPRSPIVETALAPFGCHWELAKSHPEYVNLATVEDVHLQIAEIRTAVQRYAVLANLSLGFRAVMTKVADDGR
jgi:hypothetical protein